MAGQEHKQNVGMVFCDGACRGNPGPGGWAFVFVSPTEIFEAGGGHPLTTNNRMEMTALLEALSFLNSTPGASDIKEVRFYIDSQYVLGGAKAWIYGWAKRGWKTAEGEEVKNMDLWKEIAEQIQRAKKRYSLKWFHVLGHIGIPGNERADVIAACYADNSFVGLHRGPRSEYSVVDIESRLPDEEYDPNRNSRVAPKGPTGKAYYISLIDGEVFRDETWSACEARVKGRRGAKYKKVKSSEEEKEALAGWGHTF